MGSTFAQLQSEWMFGLGPCASEYDNEYWISGSTILGGRLPGWSRNTHGWGSIEAKAADTRTWKKYIHALVKHAYVLFGRSSPLYPSPTSYRAGTSVPLGRDDA